jgi:hypothetical protein
MTENEKENELIEYSIELNREINEEQDQLVSLLLNQDKIHDPYILKAFIMLNTLIHKYEIRRNIEQEIIFSKLSELMKGQIEQEIIFSQIKEMKWQEQNGEIE